MIDTHCHIFKEYYENIDEVIKNFKGYMIVSGTSHTDIDEVIELCEKYECVFGTIGVHPNEVGNISDNFYDKLESLLKHKKVVAVGEIGLDYYYDVDKNLQKKHFIKQLDIARKFNLPVVIHSRDAISDTYDILKDYSDLKISLHCYSSSLEMAYKFIKLGCKFGIDGPITFKNNVKLIELIKEIDLKHILLETDSPFLTPEPFRGKQNNPSYLVYIAEKIAQIKGVSIEEVLKITNQNAISQFDLPVHL